jgi:hypothetical protein
MARDLHDGAMPARVPLPSEFSKRPFTPAEGRARGLGADRMRGPDLARPFHGVRVGSGSTLEGLSLCHAYAKRAPRAHFFSHVTAALLWRVPLPRELEATRELHVAVMKPSALPRAAGVRGHRLGDGDAQIVHRHGLRVVDAATTWRQLGAVLEHADLVAAADHLVLNPHKSDGDQRPFVSLSVLAERALRFRGPGGVALRAAIGSVREGVESRTETHLRLLLVRSGLPEPELGQDIFDSRGRWLARVDMVYLSERVIVEYDGEQHRTDSAQYEKDLRRVERLRENGWTVIQVRKAGLYVDPQGTIRRIARALQAGGGAG